MKNLLLSVFISCLASPLAVADVLPDVTLRNISQRGNFANSLWKFQQQHAGHVAFMGGSITEMEGYRPLAQQQLAAAFPGAKLTFTNAGISSTCSTTGAMRLERDVLSKGNVDLFLLEFAVNDDQDAGHARRECIRGMEGIVRQVRTHNPRADIAVVYFVNPAMLAQIQAGKTPLPIAAHEAVCKHYGVSSVYLAKEVADRIDAKELDWKTYGGTHPKLPGNRLAAAMLLKLLRAGWDQDSDQDSDQSDAKEPKPHPLPEQLLDSGSYTRGRFVSIEQAEVKKGFVVDVPNWSQIKGGKRSRFVELPILSAKEPGDSFTLRFTGTAVGAYLLAGPDAAKVRVQINEQPAREIDLRHRYSAGLHYPRTVIFATDLKRDVSREHSLKVTILPRDAGKGGQPCGLWNL